MCLRCRVMHAQVPSCLAGQLALLGPVDDTDVGGSARGCNWREMYAELRCFEADVDKYVYEICPYKDAAQKDGAARVNLGSWEGFRDNYSAMAFTGGQHCWNGPQRSMLVRTSSPPRPTSAVPSCPFDCKSIDLMGHSIGN